MVAATLYRDPQHRSARGHMGVIARALGSRAAIARPQNLEIRTSADLAAFLQNGERTWSGIDINPETALHISAYFAGVRMIAEDIGKLPWPVFRKLEGDKRERATDSSLWRLLHDQPNDWMDSGQFRELLTGHAVNRGNGYALLNIVRNEVRELLPVKPQAVTVEQLPFPDLRLVYHVKMASGEVKDIPQQAMFHIRGFSLDGITGVSIPSLARQGLAMARALERHGATVFGNGSSVSGVYTHPGELSDRAFSRLKEDLEDLRGEGANGVLILEEGMKWEQTALSNEDAEFLASRKFQIAEIARWLRIPLHKLAELEHATFSNIEHQNLEYVQDTLLTWGNRWDRAAKRQVIGMQRPEYAELNYDVILRTTAKERAEVARIMVGRPTMTGNEWRRLDNQPPIENDPSMDEVILPKNLDAGGPSTANMGGGNADAA